jgi:hypothetical protein
MHFAQMETVSVEELAQTLCPLRASSESAEEMSFAIAHGVEPQVRQVMAAG